MPSSFYHSPLLYTDYKQMVILVDTSCEHLRLFLKIKCLQVELPIRGHAHIQSLSYIFPHWSILASLAASLHL